MTKTDYYMIQRAIREVFARSKHYKKIRANSISKTKGKRGGTRIDCCSCGKDFAPKDIQLHHSPCVLEGDTHYNEISFQEFCRRVWADEEYIFSLCKKCHKEQHAREEE